MKGLSALQEATCVGHAVAVLVRWSSSGKSRVKDKWTEQGEVAQPSVLIAITPVGYLLLGSVDSRYTQWLGSNSNFQASRLRTRTIIYNLLHLLFTRLQWRIYIYLEDYTTIHKYYNSGTYRRISPSNWSCRWTSCLLRWSGEDVVQGEPVI